MDQIISAYEYLINLPRWKKWLIIIIIGVVFYIILYYSKVEPLKKELLQKQRKVETLILTINRLKILEKRRKELQKEIAILKKQIRNIEKKLPTGKEDVAQIVNSISKADSGMLVKKIVRKAKVNKKYYIRYPYEVELVGTYPSFISWCEKLSQANRIINFGSMEINSIKSNRESSELEGATVSIRLNVEAFTLKE